MALERFEEEPDDGLPLAGVTGKKIRTVRVGDGLWDAASEAAAAQGMFMADVVRALLVDYVRRERRRGTAGRRR